MACNREYTEIVNIGPNVHHYRIYLDDDTSSDIATAATATTGGTTAVAGILGAAGLLGPLGAAAASAIAIICTVEWQQSRFKTTDVV